MKTKKWKDIKIGDILEDNSIVTQVHPIHDFTAYKIKYRNKFKKDSIILSEDHMLLCDIRKIKKIERENLLNHFKNISIPVQVDYFLDSKNTITKEDEINIENWLKNGIGEIPKIMNEIIVNQVAVETHDVIVFNKGKFGMKNIENNTFYDSESLSNMYTNSNYKNNSILIWLNAEMVHKLVNTGNKIYCNGYLIESSFYQGIKKCRCISTNTGNYNTKNLIHHNSVTLRNIIFHALTHSYDVSICLTDLKQTEFTQFKGVNGVVAVCNPVTEPPSY